MKLSTDPDVSVRRALVANAKVTREVLQVLASDQDKDISRIAREKLVPT